MNWREVIELGKSTESIVLGEVIKTYAWKTVYGNKKSVRSKEFYDSRAIGFKPELMFEIRTVEYDDHEKIRFNAKEYAIIRTYEKGEFMEVIVSSQVT